MLLRGTAILQMRKFIIISLQVQWSLVGCAHHAEAYVDVAAVGAVGVTAGYTAVVRIVDPTATAIDAERARRCTCAGSAC